MPVVFVTDAPTASGHSYDDVLGKQYEFPLIYEALVIPGDAFVYYRGSRGSDGGRPSYFGVGVIGVLHESSRPGHLIAEVHDVRLFDDPVLAKAGDGTYIETGSTRGTNWPNGVRRIPMNVLERILGSAPIQPVSVRSSDGAHTFASPHVSEMERYSMRVAMDMLREKFRADSIREMPPGNPGFDILVNAADAELHIKVKRTVLPEPVFHLSEGERQHAAALGADFWLIVVYGIRLGSGTHGLVILDGPLDTAKVDLQPEAWTGRALHTSPPI